MTRRKMLEIAATGLTAFCVQVFGYESKLRKCWRLENDRWIRRRFKVLRKGDKFKIELGSGLFVATASANAYWNAKERCWGIDATGQIAC